MFLPRGHPLRTVQYDELDRDALEVIVPQLLRAVVVEAKNPAKYAPGELRMVPKIDLQTGLKPHQLFQSWKAADSNRRHEADL
jgi:hypothetical protein